MWLFLVEQTRLDRISLDLRAFDTRMPPSVGSRCHRQAAEEP
jgi:hypothetical protein